MPAALESVLPIECNRLLVSVGYAETEAEPTPILPSAPMSSDNPVEHARIEEGFDVTLTPLPPGKRAARRIIPPSLDAHTTSIPLAVLQRKGTRWVVELSPRSTRTKSARTKSKKDTKREK